MWMRVLLSTLLSNLIAGVWPHATDHPNARYSTRLHAQRLGYAKSGFASFKTGSAIRSLDPERPGCSSIVDGDVSVTMRRKLMEQKRSEDRLGTDFRYVSFIRILFSSNLRFNYPCYLPSKQ